MKYAQVSRKIMCSFYVFPISSLSTLQPSQSQQKNSYVSFADRHCLYLGRPGEAARRGRTGLVRGLLLGTDPCGLYRPHEEGFPCWLCLSQPPASGPPGILHVLERLL